MKIKQRVWNLQGKSGKYTGDVWTYIQNLQEMALTLTCGEKRDLETLYKEV